MSIRFMASNFSYNDMHMDALHRSPLLRSSAYLAAIAVCMLAIVTIRILEPADAALLIHGAYDGLGHLLTALVAAIGVRALHLPVPIWSVLLGGVMLDLGHLAQMTRYVDAVDGSSRSGSHSITAVIILACLGLLFPRRANVWLGIAIGAISHLWRDMGTGTVPLMWPVTETVYGTLYSRYLAGLTGMAIAMVGSGTLLAVYSQAIDDNGAP